MAQVFLQKLEKVYPPAKNQDPFLAVKSIDLEIEDGEFMVLVGPSGCGKSTTLRMIAGLEDITRGSITIGNRVVNDTLPKDRGIAMVFQNYALYPHMSVFDNMAFGLKLAQAPKEEIHQRVMAAAEILGMQTLLDRKPKALSGGQRQRVAVGRAIVRQPDVFLFDEPLSNLDAKMRVSMRTEISKLHAKLGATMIYVTHDHVEAMTMGDRICVMRDGEIVASFIGSPPMNLIHGEVRKLAGTWTFIENAASGEAADSPPPLTLPLDDRLTDLAGAARSPQVILGIRPEHVGLDSRDSFPSCPIRIEAVETMGAETHVHASTTSHRLIARLPADGRYRLGETLSLTFNSAAIHLFDAATEKVLSA